MIFDDGVRRLGYRTRKWFESTKDHLRAVQIARERRKRMKGPEIGRVVVDGSPEIEGMGGLSK